RWWAEREFVAVADAGYASVLLLASFRRFLPKPVTFITRLRLNAALYAPAPPRKGPLRRCCWGCSRSLACSPTSEWREVHRPSGERLGSAKPTRPSRMLWRW
ncbi:MAG: hypothetical protein M3122_04625, partial [Actinomycetota bacterium]|nr:hypothetical protein [Actinomycetota bacterium]